MANHVMVHTFDTQGTPSSHQNQVESEWHILGATQAYTPCTCTSLVHLLRLANHPVKQCGASLLRKGYKSCLLLEGGLRVCELGGVPAAASTNLASLVRTPIFS